MSEGHSGSHLPVYKKVIGGLFLLTLVEFGLSFWMHAGFPMTLGIVYLYTAVRPESPSGL